VQRNGTNDATSTSSTKYVPIRLDQGDRRTFIGGSDARIIMGGDEAELIRLWREKRGEVELEDLADNLAVQLGAVTEDLIRRWYQRNTGLPSRMRKSAFSIPSTNGWRPVWMGWLILVVRWSKPNSCCPGTSGAAPKP